MRTEYPEGQKERLFVPLAQLRRDPLGHLGIGHVLRRDFKSAPVKVTGTLDPVHRPLRRQWIAGSLDFLGGPILIPRRRIGIYAVIDLPRPAGPVAVPAKRLWEGHGVRHRRPPRLAVVVYPRPIRRDSGHQRSTGRIARRGRCIGAGEEGRPAGEADQVRRLGLRMPTHGFDPIVEVVHGDEQHVGPLRRNRSRKKNYQKRQEDCPHHRYILCTDTAWT